MEREKRRLRRRGWKERGREGGRDDRHEDVCADDDAGAHRHAEGREGGEHVAGDPRVEEDALAVGLVGHGDAGGGLDVEAGAEAAERVREGPGVAARVRVDEGGAVLAGLVHALLEAADVVLHRAGGDGVAAGVDLGAEGRGVS